MIAKQSKATKLFAAVLAVLMVLAMSPATAFAATKKTVKSSGFTTSVSTVNKKATVVKKGTTTVKYKGNEGWIAFKAPKTKTYTFTFSNFKDSKNTYNCHVGTLMVSTYSNKSITYVDVKTQGGKSNTLWFVMNGSKPFASSSATEQRRASRYAKIKLKKGQKIYFYTYGVNKGSCKLTIK